MLTPFRRPNGSLVEVDISAKLGQGGQGQIYAIRKTLAPGSRYTMNALSEEPSFVAKIYGSFTGKHMPTDEDEQKIAIMVGNPPIDPMSSHGHISFAWPIDLLYFAEGTQRFAGFLMPLVTASPIHEFYNFKSRRKYHPQLDCGSLHLIACNLASAVGAIHKGGYVIGDMNESNIRVTDRGLTTLLDTDSYQVSDSHSGTIYRCNVASPGYTPRELCGKNLAKVDREPEQDHFGLAVLIFKLLMEGFHPFMAVSQIEGNSENHQDDCIYKGYFPYGEGISKFLSPPPQAPPFGALHPALQKLFKRCFITAHGYPNLRPGPKEWMDTLEKAARDLIACRSNIQHKYGRHLEVCPWCERSKILGKDPFPSTSSVQNKMKPKSSGGNSEDADKGYHEATTWGHRGVTLEKQGKYEEALKSYERAIQIEPDDPSSWYNRGIALSELGRYEKALKSYDRAVQIEPNYRDAWAARCVVLVRSGRHDEAQECRRKFKEQFGKVAATRAEVLKWCYDKMHTRGVPYTVAKKEAEARFEITDIRCLPKDRSPWRSIIQ